MPDWYDKASPEDQAALEMNCTIVNADDARNCDRKQKCLAEWINNTPADK